MEAKEAKVVATLIATAFAGALALSAAAGPIERRCPAARDAIVEAENPSGSIAVETWDRGEVSMTATFQRGVEDVLLECASDRARVRIVAPGNPMHAQVQLKLMVPAASRLELRSANAPIAITNTQGSVRAETVNGSVTVSGSPREVEVQVVNGGVETSGGSVSTHVEAVNGAVAIRDAGGRVSASTVNGRLSVAGATFERAHLGTVSGMVTFEGGLASRGSLDVETVSGQVELVLPAQLDADLRLSSFSGQIDFKIDGTVSRDGQPGSKGHRRHWGPEKNVTFTLGRGGASIAVQTLSGAIKIRTATPQS